MVAGGQRSLVDEYYPIHVNYTKLLGPKTVVLIEIGEFYCVFAIDNEEEKWGLVIEVAGILGIQLMRAWRETNDRDFPLQCGVNSVAVKKHINTLLGAGYTVVLYEQKKRLEKTKTGRVKEVVTREVTEILSPAIVTDAACLTDSANYIASVYWEKIGTMRVCGVTLLDVSTGQCLIDEFADRKSDPTWSQHELVRIFESYPVREIVYIPVDVDTPLPCGDVPIHMQEPVKEFGNISYQEKYLSTIWAPTKIPMLEQFELSYRNYATQSLIHLLQFVYLHSPVHLKHLQQPQLLSARTNLHLQNNTICQLDLELFNKMFNRCVTPMGKRLFHDRIISPSVDPTQMVKEYDRIDLFLHHPDRETYIRLIEPIRDIERIVRRAWTGKIHPYELHQLYTSYKQLVFLHNHDTFTELKLDLDVIDSVQSWIQLIEDTFVLEQIQTGDRGDLAKGIFQSGQYDDLDDLESKRKRCQSGIDVEKQFLAEYCDDPEDVHLCHNDRDGHYLTIGKKRWQKILGQLPAEKKQHYDTKVQTSNMKIVPKSFPEFNKTLRHVETEINLKSTYYFTDWIEATFVKQSDAQTIRSVIDWVATLDISLQAAQLASVYKYCRPNIVESDHSFFDAEELRHPIVEKLNDRERYVPNDLQIATNDENSGMILLGPNAGGKSTLLRSTGLAIIMAQSGLYVAASRFTFSPFNALLTRIIGNDDLKNGKSSFEVEMRELNPILRRADERTLVLGDELCRGTEIVSAVSIVSATIQHLSERRVPFFFATHFHILTDLPEITRLSNLRFYHIEVTIAPDQVTYIRKLRPGSGGDLYGIEIAHALGVPDSIIDLAYETRRKLIGQTDQLIPTRTSHFNAKVIIDKCQVCGDEAEHTHHIFEQKDADEYGHIGTFHKNEQHNLVALCRKCHESVHHGDLVIDGWVRENGIYRLKYTQGSKQKRKIRLTDEQKQWIRENKDRIENLRAAFYETYQIKLPKSVVEKYCQ